jgi:t-SNARE complex subunit (syntaxin)
MIIKFRERYKEIAKKNNIEEDLVESISETIFSHSRERLENFNEIKYEILYIGSWSLRESKFMEFHKSVWIAINKGWATVRKAYLNDNKLEWLDMIKLKIIQSKYLRDEKQKEKIKLIKQYAEQNSSISKK